MKVKKSIFKLFFNTLFISLLFASNAFAEGGKIVLTNKVFKQVIKKDKEGNVTYEYVKPELALPGDVILYVISFENIGTDVAKDIVINNPMPNNSKYRMDSAVGKNTTISFSIDNGKTFGNPAQLVVTDASGNEWKAKPENYTHVRWLYNKSLEPGGKGEVSFKTEIKGNE